MLNFYLKRISFLQVMSAAQVIIGLGGIIFPTLTEKMMVLYGFRGKTLKHENFKNKLRTFKN